MPRFRSPGDLVPKQTIIEWNTEADRMRACFGAVDPAALAAASMAIGEQSAAHGYGEDASQSLAG